MLNDNVNIPEDNLSGSNFISNENIFSKSYINSNNIFKSNSFTKEDINQKTPKQDKISSNFSKRESSKSNKNVYIPEKLVNKISVSDNKVNQNIINENLKSEKKIILTDLNFWKKVYFAENIFRSENNVNKETLKLEGSNLVINQKDFYFGNFEHFYYNKFLSVFNDERLKYFDEEMIINKKCLDIGCNNGILTILIALNFRPEKIDGIDIDAKLIKKAIKNYKYVLRNNLNKNYIDNLIIVGKTDNEVNGNILEEIMLKDNNINKNKFDDNNKELNKSGNLQNVNSSNNNIENIYNEIPIDYNDQLANTITVINKIYFK